MGKKWLPLESNPEVMASFAHTLGLPADVGFHDVFGFDPDLLAMVPQPVHAVLLLFPITDASEKAKDEEAARIAAEGQVVSDKVYYMRQTIGNACGTIGIIHAVGNNLEKYDLAHDSYFAKTFAATAALTRRSARRTSKTTTVSRLRTEVRSQREKPSARHSKRTSICTSSRWYTWTGGSMNSTGENKPRCDTEIPRTPPCSRTRLG